MTRPAGRIVAAASAAATLATATAAQAHVKWFCAFDVAGQPVGLENVLCPDFEALVALSMAALAGGALLERTQVGNGMVALLNALTRPLRAHSELMIRGVLGAFLVSLWTLGGVLLTPELKTDLAWVPNLQLAMAACLLHRRTMPLCSLGIVALWLVAMRQYGIFHLLDYPVFLGIAGYVALCSTDRRPCGITPMAVLRYSAGITLMWASVEKWAYPEWTYPLFATHSDMAMGLDPDFFMRAAGAVEFAFAFGLVWTPLVRRVSAIFLVMIFVSAIGPFGKIDAIGHSNIIAVLLAIVFDDSRTEGLHVLGKAHWRKWMAPSYLMPVSYPVALAVFLGSYYGLHSALYNTSIL